MVELRHHLEPNLLKGLDLTGNTFSCLFHTPSCLHKERPTDFLIQPRESSLRPLWLGCAVALELRASDHLLSSTGYSCPRGNDKAKIYPKKYSWSK